MLNKKRFQKKLVKVISLRIIESLEKMPTRGRILINLFNSGILIDSNKVRKSTLKVLKEYIKNY